MARGRRDTSLAIGWASRRGRRSPVNQDTVGWHIPQDASTRRHKGAVFVVADGIGGRRGGDVASKGFPHPPFETRQ